MDNENSNEPREGESLEEFRKRKVQQVRAAVVEPQFSKGVLEPRFVFMMKTKHDLGAFKKELEATLAEQFKFLPKAEIAKLVATNTSKNQCVTELHSVVVAEDKITGSWELYLGQYHIKDDNSIKQGSVHKAEEGEEDESVNMLGNARTFALVTRTSPEWKGEREVLVEADCESWEEFVALMKGGVREAFEVSYPKAILGTMSVRVRKELVGKYGEAKVKALEEKAAKKLGK